jgi:MYXO-CTERM domain-containing protein
MRGLSLALLVALAGSAAATTNHTIAISAGGAPDCSVWATDEQFVGNDSTGTWITWDATSIYVGFLGGADGDQRILGIDTDTTDSSDNKTYAFNGVQFGPNAAPDLFVGWSPLVGTFISNVAAGGVITTVPTPLTVVASALGTCSTQSFIELKIDRSVLGASVATRPPIGVIGFFVDGTGKPYAAMPGSNVNTCDPDGGGAWDDEVYFPDTGDKHSPTTFGIAGAALGYALAVPTGQVVYGTQVSYTVTLVAPSCAKPAAPTGNVTFTDGTSSGPGQIVSGVATVSAVPAAGTHTIQGTFPGSTGFLPVTGSKMFTVKAATTQTEVTSTDNPAVFEEPLAITATVSSNGGTAPTGAISFMNGGTTTLVQLSDNGNGTSSASLDLTGTAPGTYTIVATYEPADGNFMTSMNQIGQQIDPAGTTTLLTSSSNPSSLGTQITLTATVSANDPSVGVPDGMVSFMDGSTDLADVTLDSNGQATFNVTPAAGTTTYHVVYAGTATGYLGSTSTNLDQVVDAQAVTIRAAISPSPGVYGSSFTISVTVSGSSAGGTPTGTVTALGVSVPLSGGTATIDLPGTLDAGVDLVDVSYSGDSTYGAATGTASVTVAKDDSAVALDASPNPVDETLKVTLSATVTAADGFVSTALGGSVTFKDSGIPIGTIAFGTTPGNTVQLQVTAQGVGTHHITAVYSGDGNLNSSTSTTDNVVVRSLYDAGVPPPDATPADAAPGTPDAAPSPDAGPRPDARPRPDAGGGSPDAGLGGKHGGCGCHVGSPGSSGSSAALLLLAGLVVLRRRRRR